MLGGSSANGGATASSDLDIVVLVPGPPAPHRETVLSDGRLVELFVHTVESARTSIDREIAARRSPLLQMCGASVLLVDHDGAGTRVRDDARRSIAAGPPALSTRERDDRRYAITALAEDLLDATDDDEVAFIGAAALVAISELVLLEHRTWLGRGKWLARRLRQAAPATAADLVAAHRHLHEGGGAERFVGAVLRALAPSGGRLAEGYVRS
ncbi:nucleotidyltransferase domain-containing protein [Pseudonocardia sp. S2-4]|uniref:Nucleotidyltransferase domain-containing protein n=2 Tax=Pseudonocardia humida TaxID=2800819 RepID=A0ABT0ZU68_9PSEU|nr:nucleotidyltransferase domain-containing protein [Pseudonocardia humida]